MNTLKEKTIAEMVTEDFRKAGVFRKYGIDFCCGGKKPLSLVAEEKHLDLQAIEADLRTVETSGAERSGDASSWTADFLSDYIINVHHAYVKRTNPNILAWSEKVAMRHGDRHLYLHEVASLVKDIVNELDTHMFKEENILFPYISQLAKKAREGEKLAPPFGTVANPIHMMENEHEQVGQMIQRLSDITSGYNPPADACNTFRILFATLKEYEDDLFLHIHLENNILFPKALRIESTGKE